MHIHHSAHTCRKDADFTRFHRNPTTTTLTLNKSREARSKLCLLRFPEVMFLFPTGTKLSWNQQPSVTCNSLQHFSVLYSNIQICEYVGSISFTLNRI